MPNYDTKVTQALADTLDATYQQCDECGVYMLPSEEITIDGEPTEYFCSEECRDHSRPFYTITADDINSPTIRAFNRVWLVSDFIGRVLSQDVGKRVYLVHGVLQVEEQLQERTHVD